MSVELRSVTTERQAVGLDAEEEIRGSEDAGWKRSSWRDYLLLVVSLLLIALGLIFGLSGKG